MNHGFMKLPTNRKNFDSYPSRALFEAIINALAQRDYLIDGSQISVDMFKNRLTITSPGNIYDGKEFGPTYDLSSFASKRRNELISQVFVHCNVMEAKGTGFEKIVEDYKDQDQYHKPYIFFKNNQFSIVLPDVTYEEGVLPSSSFINIKGNPGVPDNYASSILLFCLRERKTVNEITLNLGISNSTYFRNNILKKLVDEGYLISSKEGRISKYLTNKEKVSF